MVPHRHSSHCSYTGDIEHYVHVIHEIQPIKHETTDCKTTLQHIKPEIYLTLDFQYEC